MELSEKELREAKKAIGESKDAFEKALRGKTGDLGQKFLKQPAAIASVAILSSDAPDEIKVPAMKVLIGMLLERIDDLQTNVENLAGLIVDEKL